LITLAAPGFFPRNPFQMTGYGTITGPIVSRLDDVVVVAVAVVDD
jgi:hypothetical protein